VEKRPPPDPSDPPSPSADALLQAVGNAKTVRALPSPGQVVAGKYRIERLLGQGGMGAVFVAKHELLHQPVALKVMLGDTDDSGQSRLRFLNEARAAAKIEGEHVARVFDVGESSDGSLFIAMELLEGSDLSQLLAARGSLPVSEVVDYVAQALHALAQAHALGIVHRDLKPANLFLARRRDATQVVKVLDFGISKAMEPVAGMSPSTLTGSVLGTPFYMAPEQVRDGRTVDARTDIWAIGVILFELLAGRRPFDGRTVAEVFASILERTPPALREIREDLPEALTAIVMRCLAKDARERFASVEELGKALVPFAPTSSIERVIQLSAPASSGARGRSWFSSNRVRWAAIAVSVIAGFALLRTLRPSSTATTSATASAAAAAGPVPHVSLLDLPLPTTSNREALDLFTKGRVALHDARGGATALFKRATELDPEFAAAHLYVVLADPRVEQRVAYEKAFALADKLGARDLDVLKALEPRFMRDDLPATVERLKRLLDRRPGDAQLWLVLASMTTDPGERLALVDRALSVDPSFALAVLYRSTAELELGREDDALSDLDRCRETTPSAGDCLSARIDILSSRGECAAAEKDAREWQRLRPDIEAPYQALVDLLAAQGRAPEAMREVLRQANAATQTGVGDYLPWGDGLSVNIDQLSGDFAEATRKTEAEAKRFESSPLDAMHWPLTLDLVWTYTEMGDVAKAAAAARSYLARRDGFMDARLDRDITVVLLATELRAGLLSPADFARKREERVAAQHAAGVPDWRVWIRSYAAPAWSEAEAKEAMAAFVPLPLNKPWPPDLADVGRVFFLARRSDDAIAMLDRAVRSCRVASYPMPLTWAAFFLAMAREARGQRAEACAAYQVVLDRWGHATPRSVTAEKALARTTSLGCSR